MKNFLLLFLLVTPLACQRPMASQAAEPGPEEVGVVVQRMTRLMLHDVTNPPLAARFYAYATLAGYTVLSQHDSVACPGLAGTLRGLPRVARPAGIGPHSARLAALLAMYQVAGKLQPSGGLLQAPADSLVAACRQRGMDAEMAENSRLYAAAVAPAILQYAKADGYYRMSSLPRYAPAKGPAHWYPTPPAYLPPVEPYFRTVRPFLLDSAAQCRPAPPVAFDARPGSGFYQLMREVQLVGDSLTPAQRAVAAFWDCNPFAVQDQGHLQFGLKKMSPGGHWMRIADLVGRQQHLSFAQNLRVQTLLAVTLTDAFICCWDEKYRSDRVRPETAIRRYLNPDWQPLLQTPPFPEYLSGHSVISAAAAELFTRLLGDNVAFTDTSEEPFGLPARRFASFRQAAAEAAISRLYGGIHFRDAVEEGQRAGQRVGQVAVARLLPAAAVVAKLAPAPTPAPLEPTARR